MKRCMLKTLPVENIPYVMTQKTPPVWRSANSSSFTLDTSWLQLFVHKDPTNWCIQMFWSSIENAPSSQIVIIDDFILNSVFFSYKITIFCRNQHFIKCKLAEFYKCMYLKRNKAPFLHTYFLHTGWKSALHTIVPSTNLQYETKC